MAVILFAGVFAASALSGVRPDTGCADEKQQEKLVVMCDSTATACVMVVVPELNVLFEQSPDVISRVGLSPADLISVTIEQDVKKALPELWALLPEWSRSKLKGAIVISHRGKVVLEKAKH